MPKAASSETRLVAKPAAMEMFTDRRREQELLREVLAPSGSGPVRPELGLTVFYGLGGVGKSTLCRRGLEILKEEEFAPVRPASVDFDKECWSPTTSWISVADHLACRLVATGVGAPMASSLLALYAAQGSEALRSGGTVEEQWSLAVDALDKGVELAGIPGLSLAVKGVKWFRESVQNARLRDRIKELRLWPGTDAEGRLDLSDLENKIGEVLFQDVLEYLRRRPGEELRLFVDGFERLQGDRTSDRDAQRHFQGFLGYFAAGDREGLGRRFRTLLFSRRQLKWDELYGDDGWRGCWTQHLLGGLAEADARDFIRRNIEWFRSQPDGGVVAATIDKMVPAILDATDERADGQSAYFPFYLDLAVELIRTRSPEVPDLGRGPKDLQERFFRYLDARERRALKVLALAEEFDGGLFDWLAERRLVEYPVHAFDTDLRRDHSYFIEDPERLGFWRFHRLFEDALHAQWRGSNAERQAGRKVVADLLGYFAGALEKCPEREWIGQEAELWRRGMEIIVTQGPETGLLEHEAWEGLLQAAPWNIKHHLCRESRFDFARRLLGCYERKFGPEHPKTLSRVKALADLLYAKGLYGEAEPLYRRVLETRERTLGPEHAATLTSVADMADLLRAKGLYGEAEPLYRRALEARERTLGPDHPSTLTSVNNLGVLLSAKGDYAGAEVLYRRALAARERTLGSDHPSTLNTVHNLGALLNNKGDYTGAEAMYRRVLETWERTLGPDHPSTLTGVCNLGYLLSDKGDYVGAEAMYRRALEARERILGSDHPDTLISAGNLGLLLSAKGDYAGAEILCRRVLETLECTLGPDHPSTLTGVCNLGNLLSSKGDYAGAEAMYRRALEARERTLGPDHPSTLSTVNSLGLLLSDKGDYAGAEVLCRRALEARERTLGPDHPSTLSTINGLGILLSDKGDYAGAEAMYRRALEARERTLGPEHPSTLTSVGNLGLLLQEKGDYAGAEVLCRRAFEARERTLGPDHPDTVLSVNNLAVLLRKRGDYLVAEPLCHRVVATWEKSLGPEHPDTLISVSNLAALLHAKGDFAAAEPLCRRAQEAQERLLGSEHPRTLVSLTRLGCLLAAKGDLPGAWPLLERALETRKKILSADSPEIAASQNNLGRLLFLSGDLSGARSLLEAALAGVKSSLGPEHPDMLTVVGNLAELLEGLGEATAAASLRERLEKASAAVVPASIDCMHGWL